ncbi:galactoside 2-alpha-l-fucosyltransferase [Quercus suber]|uniref:Fucosyltransferase n=1 Tax=Quercus suber TaxID=58331 RepID=A0AAW0LGW9_QUESU
MSTPKMLKVLVASLVAFPLLVTLTLVLQNPPANRIGEVFEASALEKAAHNVTSLHAGSEDVSSQFTEMPKDKLLGGLLASGFDEGSCLSSGWGNRVLTLTSAFLYALLTNRVLLVDQGIVMTNLFSHDYDDHDKLFLCDQDQTLLSRVPWLIMKSDNYFVPSLFLMPSFEQELSKLFPQKDTVFHHLGRYLFHPSNHVWGLITRYYEAYLAKANERIGIQIRNFDTGPGPFQYVMDQVLACTLKYKVLPQVDRKRTIVTQSEKANLKAILITSLSSGTLRIQGLGGLKPWILYKSNNQTTPNPPCRMAMSMEPCFHAPPFYDCKTKKGIDNGALVPHVRHCEDMSWGIKLVDNHDEL